MVATNSVAPRTGNVSVGTSIFAMVVLERELSYVHHELDLVTTPPGPGRDGPLQHGASELGAWAGVFAEFAAASGVPMDSTQVFETLFRTALHGAWTGGRATGIQLPPGEPITGLEEGRPLFLRTPSSELTLANFVRAHLFTTFATRRLGMDVLHREEDVRVERLFGRAGLFKTEGVAQRVLAAALDAVDAAAEGGAWRCSPHSPRDARPGRTASGT